MSGELLLVVHPYGEYDGGVTTEDVEQAVDAFDGDTAVVKSRSDHLFSAVHGAGRYDEIILDTGSDGELSDRSLSDIGEYDQVTLGGGYTGVEGRDACLQRCYRQVRDVVDRVGIAPDLLYNADDDAAAGDGDPYRVADRGDVSFDRPELAPFDGPDTFLECVADDAVRHVDGEVAASAG